MRYWLKVFGLVLLAAILMGVFFVAGAVLQPRPIIRAWTNATAPSDWSRLNRHGQMLRQGMTPAEVKAILGGPGRAEDVENGIRWFYYCGGCAGDELIVEFRSIGPPGFKGESRLCYAHQGQSSVAIYYFPDTDPEYFTIGKPLKSH